MKMFLRLRMLCFLVLQAWTQSYPVRTECSLFRLQVFVRKFMFNDGVGVSPNDLTLGHDCQVNNVQAFEFGFHYSVRECGIGTKVYATVIVFEAVVHYNPQYAFFLEFNHSKTDFYVECIASRVIQEQYSLTPGQNPQSSIVGDFLFPTPKVCLSPKQ